MTSVLATGSVIDTIFALASGTGRAAISIIRISGDQTSRIVQATCGACPAPRHASLRHLHDAYGDVLDQALVLWMPAPASYTGEDCAELQVHGGRAVLASVTGRLLELGARPADPGEFTRRAFLAGKMDLLEAEAVADLVAAETDMQRRQALRQHEGMQSRMLAGWHERLSRALAFQEALIDFPDEDLPPDVEAALIADIGGLCEEMALHAGLARQGERLRQGVVIAVVGAPNAGKSSLVNTLARRDIAIVSPVAGTTRDAIEVTVDLAGVPVTLIDTAGLRLATDPVEAEGVARARARAASADAVLLVVDASDVSSTDLGIAPDLVVANKIDLAPALGSKLGISLRTGEGLLDLDVALQKMILRLVSGAAHPVLTQARHAASLRDASAALRAALVCALPELRGEELRVALRALGRITGSVDAEAILDVVFGQFCIGK